MSKQEFKADYNASTRTFTFMIIGRLYSNWDVMSVSQSFNEAIQNGAEKVDILLHSPGGDAYTGFGIYSLIQYFKKQVPVEIHILALCASAATFIAMAGDRVYMNPLGTFMIHNCSGELYGTAEEIEKGLAEMRKINEMMVDGYAARTGKTKEQIKALMDAETSMTAEEALKGKFIDVIKGYDGVAVSAFVAPAEINATKKSISEIFNNYITKMAEDTNKNKPPVAEIQNVPPVTNLTPEEQKWMADNQHALSKFQSWMKDGSDKKQVENVTAILNRVAEAEQKVAVLEAKLLQAEKQRKEDLLDAAVVDGRITASERSKYDGLTYEQISAFIKDLKPAIKPTQLVERIFKANDRNEWTFDDWARKDPDGLSQMEKENPERFNALYSESKKK